MFRYKLDVITELKRAGYSSYRIRKEGTINQTALQKLRDGKMIAWDQLDIICTTLHLQPGDLIEHVPAPVGDAGRTDPGRVSPVNTAAK